MLAPLFDYFSKKSSGWAAIDSSAQVIMPQRLRDVLGKLKISMSQNIYDADFEYGTQPLRWEALIYSPANTASIAAVPGSGGVRMQISQPNDITIRQTRPYHRYQPGKSMFLASNVNFGGTLNGQFQRVGLFDDSNGIFFMQSGTGTPSNPYGMSVVVRSDANSGTPGLPVDTVFDMTAWNGNQAIAQSLNWSGIQMIWMEYAWYGAGALRWGVYINGEPYILHQIGTGNGTFTGSQQQIPWSRTGNLPARYEQRNNATTTGISTFFHYGVSVLIEGRIDDQRGFTYSYGMNPAIPRRNIALGSTRFPVLSFQMRPMGVDQFDQNQAPISAGTTTSLTINPTAIPGFTSIVGAAGLLTITFSSAFAANQFTVGGNITLSGFSVSTALNANYQILTINAANTVITAASTFVGTATLTGGVATQWYANQWVGKFLYYQAAIPVANLTTTIATATITGTIAANSNVLVVTATSAPIYNGMVLTGTNITAGCTIQSQWTSTAVGGVQGGAGTYAISASNAGAGSGITGTGGQAILTYSSGFPTGVYVGQQLILSGSASASLNGQFTIAAVNGTTSFNINIGNGNNPTAANPTAISTPITARVSSNTTTVLTITDIVTATAPLFAPTAGNAYILGLVDRGQLLPRTLLLSSDQVCVVELIASTTANPISLAGANFVNEAQIGSYNSFAQRDVSAVYAGGGEVVYAFTAPAGGSGLQALDLSNFFPLLTNIRGNVPDVVTVAVTTPATGTAPNVGVNVICQEAMA